MTGVIFITSDTLRADHLGCYGAEDGATPNLDRLAAEGTVFDRDFAASYPTVPNRLDVWTGQYNFLRRGWQSLDTDDAVLPEYLGDNGIVSNLVFDTPFLGTYGFTRGFDGWQQVRGHHSDQLITDPTLPTDYPAQPHKLKQLSKVEQYLRNRADWRHEGDYIAPRTFSRAIEWLERNREHDEFCLVIDAWDPHEVFDPPSHYLERYDDTPDDVEEVIYPAYGRPDYMSDDELEHVKARYRAEVSMVDRWLGELLDAVDRLGLSEEVLLIFTSDHGHLFGEHDLQGKPTGRLGKLYNESVHTPLIVRHPDGVGAETRVEALTQPPDILPTILDYFDIPVPDAVHGSSLLPLLSGSADDHREFAVAARYPEGPGAEAKVFDGWAGPANVVSPVSITDGRWFSVVHPNSERSELYDLANDPDQLHDVADENPNVATRLQETYVEFMTDRNADDRMVEPFTTDEYTADEIEPERTIYTFRNGTGRRFAHLTESRARERAPETASAVEADHFGALLDEPETLVYINQQYYYAADLDAAR